MFGQDTCSPLAPQGYYGNAGMEAKMARQPTLQERLDLAVAQAEDRLAKVKEAREIFSRNPDIERLLNLMQSNTF